MSSPLYEIIELKDGTLSLRPANSEDEALVSIKFSAEANDFLADTKLEVVRAMIEAGFEAVSDISERELVDKDQQPESSLLH
jgi:hypothetical protein